MQDLECLFARVFLANGIQPLLVPDTGINHLANIARYLELESLETVSHTGFVLLSRGYVKVMRSYSKVPFYAL
ncbi:unnamed protein product [Penicillium roqueforti FM164]|uniref:Genomic scaffold, ProqFM164S03 n=1 Tax=Penicillium roqueforti (strain FM164) TaxID=1365484 RepID=W6QEL3_PENRF|nr:unnamed protein product [Penicillium roqueforti FM164]